MAKGNKSGKSEEKVVVEIHNVGRVSESQVKKAFGETCREVTVLGNTTYVHIRAGITEKQAQKMAQNAFGKLKPRGGAYCFQK